MSSLNAGKEELLGIFSAMKNYTNSLVEVNSDFADSDFEFIANIALKYNLPLQFYYYRCIMHPKDGMRH